MNVTFPTPINVSETKLKGNLYRLKNLEDIHPPSMWGTYLKLGHTTELL